MNKHIIKSLLIIIAIFLSSCVDKSNLSEPVVNTGTADFSRFVTIGNSLTAGYQSGALYESAQLYSFGALLARQVGTQYEIPLVSDPGTGNRMEVTAVDLAKGTVTINYNTSTGTLKNPTYSKPYNNLGVPGATLYDVINATSSSNCFSAVMANSPNPMFDLILRGKGSQFQQAKSLKPTFVILWIGNNDILGYATSGGATPYTPVANFQALYTQLADSIASLGAKVVVLNIPDVLSIPFLTTIPPVVQNPSDGSLINLYGIVNGTPKKLTLGKDYLTLKAKDLITSGVGLTPTNPLPNNVVLDSAEVATAKNIITQYNNTINTLASNKGFALVNINQVLNSVATSPNGMLFDGVRFSTKYITGNLFSLDGVHPTSQGHAIIANEIIKVINQRFNANIPLINVATIPGSLILKKTYDNILIPIYKNGYPNILF